MRVGIYPNIQNKSGTRFDTSPNIDFREIFYTAKGTYGELLAGRALNLYQGKNILNDMTLLTSGTIPGSAFRGGTTLGHIGYDYLYTNFGPQIRYTTPDMAGLNLMGSGYVVKGLGMLSAQDGDVLGANSAVVDANGTERLAWGYLLQATYQLTPSFKVGANYGTTRQEKNDNEPAGPPS